MATLTDFRDPSRAEARQEDLEAARTVSRVLFGVLAVGITIGVIGLYYAMTM